MNYFIYEKISLIWGELKMMVLTVNIHILEKKKSEERIIEIKNF